MPALAMARARSATLAAVPPLPALTVLAVMIVWAFHGGGYDADTWYWGALVALAALTVAAVVPSGRRLSTATRLALIALTLYVAWSYLSIAWAGYQGDALEGSNRALLYLLVFALFAVLPWKSENALWTLVLFVLAVAVIELSVLVRLVEGSHAASMFSGSRLATPTGYFNATAALFTMTALLATVLATRPELPQVLRGLLLAVGCGGLQLALLCQSRGWLFTLPIVAVLGIAVVRDRLRVVVAAVLPVAGTLAAMPKLLDVFTSLDRGEHTVSAFRGAGAAALITCGVVLILGTLLALFETRVRPSPLTARARRVIGGTVAAVTILVAVAGGVAATHGHPFRFISRQWSGFTNAHSTNESSSHFAQVGSGRYDFWRVSVRALRAHPLTGLGQDNFAEYYVTRRRTSEEPKWTHSLEMRLLAHTGAVGFLLFAGFLGAALFAALGRRRAGTGLGAAVAGAAVLPLVVWFVHGSVDWFWEMPALTGPALGFLGMAGAIGADRVAPGVAGGERLASSPDAGDPDPVPTAARAGRVPRAAWLAAGAIAVAACTAVLGFPYLSVRELSKAKSISSRNSAQALRHLKTAADLNPLSAEPARLAGTVALDSGRLLEAQQRFRQAIARDPGGWYGWFGAGVAASALGDSDQAKRDFTVAASINSRQPAVTQALRRVDTLHPLTPGQALRRLVVVQ
jgi:O-Antigen ligase